MSNDKTRNVPYARPGVNGGSGQSGGFGNERDAPIWVGACFYGGPYPPSSLVKNATEQLVLLFNRFEGVHA